MNLINLHSINFYNFIRMIIKIYSYLFLLLWITTTGIKAQTSGDNYNGKKLEVKARGYSFSGKMDNRILFMSWINNRIEIIVFDTLLKKESGKTIILNKQLAHTVMDIVCTEKNFTIVDYTETNNIGYLKLLKYDNKIRLIDSANIPLAPKYYLPGNVAFTLSENKKMLLFTEKNKNDFVDLCAIDLSMLTKKWSGRYTYKSVLYNKNSEQFSISNFADAFIFLEQQPDDQKSHRLSVLHYDTLGSAHEMNLPCDNLYPVHTCLSVDNFNQKLCVAGIYGKKNLNSAEGTFNCTIPVSTNIVSDIEKNIFDTDFVSQFTGKISTKKELSIDLRVQQIIHQRDGGMLLIVEEVNEYRFTLGNPNIISSARNNVQLVKKYNYNNIFVASIGSNSKMLWRLVIVKKQSSENDNGFLGSYFLNRTPSMVQIIFNTESKNETTVSRYDIKPAGQTQRSTILNTKGQNMQLCFRDARQIGINEILVPFKSNESVNLVRIKLQY